MRTSEPHSKFFGLMLRPSTYEDLKELAARQGVSVAAWIREAVRLRLEDQRRAG